MPEAPVPVWSGNTAGRVRLTRSGNRQLNAALHRIAITQIRIEGNRRVEPEVVKRALKNKVGRPFDPALTGADIQSLWSLGYFADIQLLTQRLTPGLGGYVVLIVAGLFAPVIAVISPPDRSHADPPERPLSARRARP